jgi:hypothetical protein
VSCPKDKLTLSQAGATSEALRGVTKLSRSLIIHLWFLMRREAVSLIAIVQLSHIQSVYDDDRMVDPDCDSSKKRECSLHSFFAMGTELSCEPVPIVIVHGVTIGKSRWPATCDPRQAETEDLMKPPQTACTAHCEHASILVQACRMQVSSSELLCLVTSCSAKSHLGGSAAPR